jgi:hypothetical protein
MIILLRTLLKEDDMGLATNTSSDSYGQVMWACHLRREKERLAPDFAIVKATEEVDNDFIIAIV